MAESSRIDLSILVVSYNTRDLTLACLRSIFQQTTGCTFELVVIDNASKDGSPEAIAEEFPNITLIRPRMNLGFAGANNLAAQHASGQYLLLLNPDMVVLDGAIQKLYAFATHDGGRSIYGGRTLYPDGSLNPTSCWGRPTLWSTFCRGIGLSFLFPGNRIFDPEALGGWKRDSIREVDIVTGCLLMLHSDLWRKWGGFDPQFFMYCEDADLCLRARRAGAHCKICPDAKVIHYRAASERVRSDKVVRLFTAKAQLFRKHWHPLAATLGVALLSLLPLTRVIALWALKSVRASQRESYETWCTIWQRRSEWARQSIAANHTAG
jgi:N-acetylglucosaminyl-diphospho-decaprenol L-rhamnosyltransferase